MALNDLTRNVVTKYKADVSDHKKGIEEINKLTKQWIKDDEEAAKKRDKSLKDQLDGMKKIVGAIAGAKLAFDGYKQVVEETRLRTAAAGVDIDKLSRAAGGLKTNMQLLGEAAKLNASSFKLTSEQMETAELAMRQLTRAGFEQEEVSKKVLDAIVKLEGDGLKDFGVRVRATTNDADKFKAIMEALGAEAKKVDGTTLTQAESMSKLGVQFEQTFDSIKRAVGDMVIALGPLIEAAATLAGIAATITTALSGKNSPVSRQLDKTFAEAGLDKWGHPLAASAASLAGSSWLSRPSVSDEMEAAAQSQRGIGGNLAQRYRNSGGIGQMVDDQLANQFGGVLGVALREWQANAGNIWAEEVDALAEPVGALTGVLDKLLAKGAKKKGGSTTKIEDVWADDGTNPLGDRFAAAIEALADLVQSESLAVLRGATYEAGAAGGSGTGGLGAAADGFAFADAGGEVAKSINAVRAAQDQAAKGKGQSFMERTFGKIGEFNAYAKAFDMLSGAVTSAMTAWIDGSVSAGKAVKMFIADSLKALATQMAVEALKHTAYGFGALALGPLAGLTAGQHFAAAGAFAIAAGAAAQGAKSLGTTASAGAAARGGAGAAPGGSYVNGNADSRPVERTIVIGNGFVEGGPRERQIYATRLVEAAITSGAVTYSS